MPFRATFDCLWCGTAHTSRGPDDLEGWAQLCPDCVGKAGDNGFLRFRLHQALTERAAARPSPATELLRRRHRCRRSRRSPIATAAPPERDPSTDMLAYYEARAPEYDDWYLRRGRYERGPVHDAAWNAELDVAGRWLDELPIHGEIVELAAGTGWWSPLLASKGELSMYDAAAAPLDRARERLVAHRLRAHLHVRDAWAEPDRQVDAVFTGFWLSHVPRRPARRVPRASSRRWLRPGGTFAFIDSLPDPQSSAADHPAPADDASVRRLDDGREFTIVKVYYEPGRAGGRRLPTAGFEDARVTTTGPLLPDRRRDGRTRARSSPGAHGARGYTPRDVPPGEVHDRDRRLRRHGRGDDRRPAPRRPGRARPGRREPSRARSGASTSRASTASGPWRPTSRRSRTPTSSCSGSSRRCSPGSGARSGRTCVAASSS